jgi:hypothetical protein
VAVSIPTTAETTVQNVANFESSLGQTVPLNDRAFFRVLSAIEAGLSTGHYKFAIDRIAQTLALTATGQDLDRIGTNYNVIRKAAVAAILEIDQPAANGTSIPVSLDYPSDDNGLRYINNATVVASGGSAVLEVTCEESGDQGNLTTGATFTIGRQIAGITSTTATYVSTITEGIDRESDDAYRRRVLQEIRTVGGGGNGVDYQRWAEEVTEVFRAFPFSGSPVGITTKLKDGDMELAGLTYWTAGNSAIITKETTSPARTGSTKMLEIQRDGVNNPYAFQYSLEVGRDYTVAGYARGDATAGPQILDGSTVLWSGSVAATWQAFSVSFTSQNTDLRFGMGTAPGTESVFFDDCTLALTDSLPGDRVVYVEVFADLDPDGIPTQAQLDTVREALNFDPETSLARMVLGTTDEKLFVEPIVRTGFDVTITGLEVEASQEAAAKASLDTGVDEYFRSIAPYVEGVTSPIDKNDTITGVKLAEVVQDILAAFSASAEEITFEVSGGSPVARYVVEENETGKLGTISYA